MGILIQETSSKAITFVQALHEPKTKALRPKALHGKTHLVSNHLERFLPRGPLKGPPKALIPKPI